MKSSVVWDITLCNPLKFMVKEQPKHEGSLKADGRHSLFRRK
jgi:hypothetical protein